jgi:hypothetical protein
MARDVKPSCAITMPRALSKMPMLSDRTKHLCLYLVLSLIVASALWWSISLLRSYNISFWLTGSDYTELSLAHGISTDLWLSGESPNRNYFHTMHPGIPFQIASWLAYRLSLLFITNSGDQYANIHLILQNPERFWLINRILSIVIMSISIFLAGLALYYCCGSVWSVLAVTSFYSYSWSLIYSYGLGNELFALLIGTAAAWLAFKSLQPESNWLWPVLFGIVCGLAYLNKLNYVAYFPGFPIACLTMILFDRSLIRPAVNSCLLSLVGFSLGLCGIGIAWLGWGGFLGMLNLHFAVLVHAGHYGQGEQGVLTAAATFEAMNQLWRAANTYIIFATSISILAVFVAFRKLLAHGQSASKAAWVIYLLISVTLCTAAALKHFSFHYFIPTAVPIVFLTGFVLANSLWIVRFAIIITTAYMLHSASREAKHYYQEVQKTGLEDDTFVTQVLDLPIKADEVRVWSYRLGSRQYLTQFIAAMVSNQRLTDMVADTYPVDKTTAPWVNWDVYGNRREGSIEEIPWRYSIIPRDVSNITSSGKGFPYNEARGNGRVILSTSRTIVVEKSAVAKQLSTIDEGILQH